MTSLQRKMQRAKFGPAEFNRRREEAGKAPEQAVRTEADGSYSALRPTKGWLRVSLMENHFNKLQIFSDARKLRFLKD